MLDKAMQLIFHLEFYFEELLPGEGDPPLARLAVGAQLRVEDAVHESRPDLVSQLGQVLAQLVALPVRLRPLKKRVQGEIGLA